MRDRPSGLARLGRTCVSRGRHGFVNHQVERHVDEQVADDDLSAGIEAAAVAPGSEAVVVTWGCIIA